MFTLCISGKECIIIIFFKDCLFIILIIKWNTHRHFTIRQVCVEYRVPSVAMLVDVSTMDVMQQSHKVIISWQALNL
jgi:hypothetical protein